MKPIRIPTSNLREHRQLKNDETISKCIRDKNYNGIENKKNCNINQLYKLLKRLGLTLEELVNKCIIDELFLKSVVMNISILSSRQGKLDETYVIEIINSTKIGINIKENGNYTAIKKKGIIVKTKDAKKISEFDRLKSFDGAIFNEKNEIIGYLFAKITYGEGGHQDNVFKEADELCEWVRNFYSDNKLYIFCIMIDTDLSVKLNKLKDKFKKISNTFIGNHVEFQEFFINKKLI